MFFHPKSKPANFASWTFAILVISFAWLSLSRPAVGLSGLGTVLILAAILIELNRETIWQGYLKGYKKSKDPLTEALRKPRQIYYSLNVYLVWPLFFLIGLAATQLY